MPRLKESTDTWSGAGQPDAIGQWGKMRLVCYQARGQDGTRFWSSSCRHSWPSPTSSTSPLGSAWSSRAWSCSYWILGSQIAGTGISGSRTPLCDWPGTRAIGNASDWPAAGSTTSWRFQGRRTASSSRTWVQANQLVRGELLIDGDAVDASQTCPVLVLAHTGDALARPSRPRPCSRWSRVPIAKP
jgi:hypothetical protein